MKSLSHASSVIKWHSGDIQQIPKNTPQCYVFSEEHYKTVYKTIIWILGSMLYKMIIKTNKKTKKNKQINC